MIDKLTEVGKCSRRGGNYLDVHCKYCGYEKKELQRKMTEDKRYNNGEETTLDILFEEIIYNSSGIDDYNMYINDLHITPEDKEFYKRFYGYLLRVGGRK